MAVSFPRYLQLMLALGAAACDSDPADVQAPAGVTITINPASLTLPVGATATLAAEVHDGEGRTIPGRGVQWSSGDPEIAEISPAGVVTARAPGLASISAQSGQNVTFARIIVQLSFRLPVTASRSVLITETGTPTPTCPSGEGGLRLDGGRDCTHAGVSRFSLDFRADETFQFPVEVVAAANGIVGDVCLQPPTEVTCGPNGPFVYVEHAGDFATIYAHLDPASVTIRRKRSVRAGQVIGTMGAWGSDPYPWIHFELRYNNQESSVLTGVAVGGRKLTDYRVGQ